MKDAEQPINPHLVHTHSGEVQEYCKGLTKREYFAGLAMQGLLAAQSPYKQCIDAEWTAKTALNCADELLKELENQK